MRAGPLSMEIGRSWSYGINLSLAGHASEPQRQLCGPAPCWRASRSMQMVAGWPATGAAAAADATRRLVDCRRANKLTTEQANNGPRGPSDESAGQTAELSSTLAGWLAGWLMLMSRARFGPIRASSTLLSRPRLALDSAWRLEAAAAAQSGAPRPPLAARLSIAGGN